MKGLATPTKVLFVFTFFAQFASVFYAAWEIDPPALLEVLTQIVFVWLFWWWLIEDSKHTEFKWPSMDLGFFLFIAWFAILPYHLFATRGIGGLVAIASFVGVYLVGWLAAISLIYLVWSS